MQSVSRHPHLHNSAQLYVKDTGPTRCHLGSAHIGPDNSLFLGFGVQNGWEDNWADINYCAFLIRSGEVQCIVGNSTVLHILVNRKNHCKCYSSRMRSTHSNACCSIVCRLPVPCHSHKARLNLDSVYVNNTCRVSKEMINNGGCVSKRRIDLNASILTLNPSKQSGLFLIAYINRF